MELRRKVILRKDCVINGKQPIFDPICNGQFSVSFLLTKHTMNENMSVLFPEFSVIHGVSLHANLYIHVDCFFILHFCGYATRLSTRSSLLLIESTCK